MLRVRLSSVITGCGGNDTTRSRRSTRARMRSMNGTNKVSCPLTVRLYRPKRSITAASACGISATDLATTMIAKITRAAATTRKAIAPCIGIPPISPEGLRLLEHHRGGTVDLHDGHLLARLVHIGLVERPRRPHLAIQLHLTFVAGDPVKHQRALALQR